MFKIRLVGPTNQICKRVTINTNRPNRFSLLCQTSNLLLSTSRTTASSLSPPHLRDESKMSTKRSFSNLDRSVLLRPTDQHLSLHSTRPITKRSSSRLYTSKVDSSNFFYNQHRYSSSSSSSKNSDSSDEARRRTEEEAEEEEIKPAGLFGKVRQLSKLYGSAALVIYGVLSAFDFGLSFLMIYLIGTDHVRTAEDYVIEKLNLKRINPIGSSDRVNRENGSIDQEQKPVGDGEIDNNMIWTTAILAYTIHKTVLLPVRVGLTAWITPPIVRALRRRGWKIGKQKI